MPKAKLMSSVEITEEPDGEQFKGLLQELQVRNPHENRGALTGCAGTSGVRASPRRRLSTLSTARLLKNVGHLIACWMIVDSVLAPAGGRRPAGAARVTFLAAVPLHRDKIARRLERKGDRR